MKIAYFRAVAAIGLFVPLLAADAIAAVYYNSYGKFTVEVLPASTIFADSLSFNGNGTNLIGQRVNGGTTDSTGTLYARFTADPGFVFTEAYLGFGPTGWSNASFSPAGYVHSGGWSIPGGSYQGTNSFRGGFGGQESNWDASGDSGTFYYRNIYTGSGGAYGYRDFMDRDGHVMLLNVQSFEVILSSTMHKDDTVDYSGYSTSLNIEPATVETHVPEPAMMPLMVASAGAAWALRRRKRTDGYEDLK